MLGRLVHLKMNEEVDVALARHDAPRFGGSFVMVPFADKRFLVRPRLEVAGADLTRVHAITAVKLKNNGRRTFDLTQDIARLEQAVRFIGNVMMIVIDPYSAYMGKPGKMDSYRSTDVRATLAPLFDMASRLEVAVLGIGHLNKSGRCRRRCGSDLSPSLPPRAASTWSPVT
jgi:hypothetical protein